MPHQRFNSRSIHTVEHVLSPKVVHIPVIKWVLINCQLQQWPLVRPGLLRIRPMVHAHAVELCIEFRSFGLQNLMDGVAPVVAMPRVDLVRVKSHTVAARGIVAPDLEVSTARGAGRPIALKIFAPTG